MPWSMWTCVFILRKKEQGFSHFINVTKKFKEFYPGYFIKHKPLIYEEWK